MTANSARAAVLSALVLLVGCQAVGKGGTTVLVVRNARVVDVDSGVTAGAQAVRIVDGLIAWVGPDAVVEINPGEQVLEAGGRFLIPGFWDVHVHLTKAGIGVLESVLAAGVTSVRDVGSDFTLLSAVRDSIRSGLRPGPTILLAGPMLERPEVFERLSGEETSEPWRRTRVVVRDSAEAERVVDSLASLGVDFIKIREVPDPVVYRAAVRRAHSRGLPVVGHAPQGLPPEEALGLGLVSIEHDAFPYPLSEQPNLDAIIDAYRAAGTAVVPTFVAWRGSVLDPDSLRAFLADPARTAQAGVAGRLRGEWQIDGAGRSGSDFSGWSGFFSQYGADVRLLADRGVPILAGSDLASTGVIPGTGLQDELILLVRCAGLSPREALASATTLPARQFGRADRRGAITTGQVADLVLLAGDPLADIEAIREVEGVIAAGRVVRWDQSQSNRRPQVPLASGIDAIGTACLR